MDEIQRAIKNLSFMKVEIEGSSKETKQMKRITVRALNTAISAMEELQQYREIGTLGECREAVERLDYYKELRQQGRLPELPCAEGDKVYRINRGAKEPIISLTVIQFTISGKKLSMDCVDEWLGRYIFREEDIGKNVFLTQEEAEEALNGG